MAIPVEATSREGLTLRRFRDPQPSRMLGAAWRARNSREAEFADIAPLHADAGVPRESPGTPVHHATRVVDARDVNGRPAAAEVVYFGLREAYHTLVLKGRYPPAVLYIDLAPERVDVLLD